MIVSDWVSVSKLDKRTYKPDVGMYIVELEEKQTKISQWKLIKIKIQVLNKYHALNLIK